MILSKHSEAESIYHLKEDISLSYVVIQVPCKYITSADYSINFHMLKHNSSKSKNRVK